MGIAQALAALLTAAAVHTPAPTSNNDNVFPHCGAAGWHVCHIAVYSRHYTKFVIAPAASSGGTGATATSAVFCGAAAGPAGAGVCALPIALMSAFSSGAANQAAAQNQCLSIDSDPTGTAYWFATYNGSACHDN